MTYKVLALKWRPRIFSEVAGQQATLQALQQSLDTNQTHHAYLFTGTRGVGKTTLARILAKCLNCETGVTSKPCGECNICTSIDAGSCIDVIEVDAASRTKVEDTRDLLDNMPYAPSQARFKIYIIDEVHMLSNHSFNALLKTLEDPPEHVKFILATTDPQKLPITVLSRCLQYHLRNFTVEQIAEQLSKILTAENITFEPAALTVVAQCANGSMRDALSLLEQVIAFGDRNVSLAAAEKILGTSVRVQILELLEKIIQNQAPQAISIVRELAALNTDFNQALKILQTAIYQLSLLKVVPVGLENTVPDIAKIKLLAAQADPLDLQLFYQACLLGVKDLPYAPDIVIGFEMIVLRMLAFQPAVINTEKVVTPKETPKEISQAISQATPQATPTITATISPAKTNSWAETIPQLNLPGLTKVIAEHCVVDKWEDDIIQLILHEAQKPLLNTKHTERLQEALEKFLQRKIKLSITVGSVNAETPAAQGQRLQQAVNSAAESAIRNDQHIQQLEQTFGAKIETINAN